LPFAEDVAYYSPEQLDAIVKAGGSLSQGKTRQELKSALEQAVLAAQIHSGIRRWETAPPARAVEFEKLAQTAGRLLRFLGVTNDGKPHVTPKLRGGSLSGLQGQGFAWARHWFRTAEREKRIATIARARERKLIITGDSDKADEMQAARRWRKDVRSKKRERWHRIHGAWPTDPSPYAMETSEGTRYLVFGEDLALLGAVEGVQRLRTWAELEAKRLRKVPPPEPVGNRRSRGVPRRKAQTFLVGCLAKLYPDFFGRPFGVSKLANPTKSGKSPGRAAGPGVRFVQACLGPLGITMSADAIEKAWDACRADSHRKMGNQTRE
jgi:hypothetical protein